MARKKIPKDRLIELHNRFNFLPVRHKERNRLVMEFAEIYGVSTNTVYRSLRELFNPKSLKRSDTGKPRQIDGRKMEMYCQTITAIKIRSMNKKGRHLSTQEAIRILEHGVNTPKGLVQAPNGLLSKSTVNYYLKRWGYDIASLSVEPVAVRFQANHSNECFA